MTAPTATPGAPAAEPAAPPRALQVFRGGPEGGALVDYQVPVQPGMVVLDAIHWIQGHGAPDLACRWNCKAAKCGSCSAEVNGRPRLMCATRMDALPASAPVVVKPLAAFPIVKDLVTDVRSNYAMARKIPAFAPRPDTTWRWEQRDIDRVQELRKCIQCFLCQDVCHVLREHGRHADFAGPAYLVQIAALEMHPADGGDRTALLKDALGLGLCNITKCCTEVCPESIRITDNAIIPLKERVVDAHFDPIIRLWRRITGKPRPREG